MREYTFLRNNGDKKIVEAKSLKKALIKYDGKPKDHDNHVFIAWINKKKTECNKLVKLPYITRKERKGKI